MTMIERVARAMCADDSPHNDWDSRDMSDFTRDAWRKMAKAAIEAMREPTDEMIAAGEAEFFEHLPEARDWTLSYTKTAYEAMIDAALKDSP